MARLHRYRSSTANKLFGQVRGIKPEDQGRFHLELFIAEHRLRAERFANQRLVAATNALKDATQATAAATDSLKGATQQTADATHALHTTTKNLADAAESSSEKLNCATWVLAGATIGLFIATVALVIVTVAVGSPFVLRSVLRSAELPVICAVRTFFTDIGEQELAGLSDTARLDDFRTGADPTRFPLTSQALPSISKTSADERFQLGLQLMLSGALSARAHRRARTGPEIADTFADRGDFSCLTTGSPDHKPEHDNADLQQTRRVFDLWPTVADDSALE